MNLGMEGLTVQELREEIPNFLRILEAIANQYSCSLNPIYRFREGMTGMANRLEQAETWASTFNLDDVEEMDTIVSVDVDVYDEYLERPGGWTGDQLIADLVEGPLQKDLSKRPLFWPVERR